MPCRWGGTEGLRGAWDEGGGSHMAAAVLRSHVIAGAGGVSFLEALLLVPAGFCEG